MRVEESNLNLDVLTSYGQIHSSLCVQAKIG